MGGIRRSARPAQRAVPLGFTGLGRRLLGLAAKPLDQMITKGAVTGALIAGADAAAHGRDIAKGALAGGLGGSLGGPFSRYIPGKWLNPFIRGVPFQLGQYYERHLPDPKDE